MAVIFRWGRDAIDGARPLATVSAPVTWEEVADGFHPSDLTMWNMAERIKEKGDLFQPLKH
ncbi:hypothetical protein ACFO8Q_11075 [Effusibacillus consociatus]|uniref:DNA ligase D polymerase domain-containing protein n=1 Tax=Effusibacillus consociatus TaxID=1117041 RepID=A0ABV9Q230_9BACL